ncbi:MAG: asparagine synthase C-terminal domain-containing protein [Thermoplasmata archaeon]
MTEDRPQRVGDALRTAVLRVAGGVGPVTVLFSGGLDSSLIAWWLAARPGLRLATLGIAESPDLVRAEAAAPRIGVALESLRLDPEEIRARWERFVRSNGAAPEPPSPIQFTFELAFERLPGRTLVTGQGADELFGGYARYDGLDPATAGEISARDLKQLLEMDWPQTCELARAHRIDLHAPFLDPEVRAAVAEIPLRERFDPLERKGYLRRIARANGLPESMAGAPKKAIQYGSGISRVLRRIRTPPRGRP